MNLSPTAEAFLGSASRQNAATGSTSTLKEWRKIRAWLLAILRFAVTLEQSDRTAVTLLAADMDCAGSGSGQATFTYFARASARFCDCILARANPEKAAELRLHISRIDDDCLRRAIEAAVFGTGAVPQQRFDLPQPHDARSV
jgi:hypothetical protein